MRRIRSQGGGALGVAQRLALTAVLASLATVAAACGDDEKPPVTAVVPDVGQDTDDADNNNTNNANNGDADADTIDGDADATEDEPDVPGDVDVIEDEPDTDEDTDALDDVDVVDEGDADGDTDGGDDADVVEDPLRTDFTASCMYPAVSCLQADQEALSCTINAFEERVEVSYGPGLATRSEFDLARGQVVTVFADGQPCFEALPLDDQQAPLFWSVADARGSGATFTVAVLPDRVRVNCPSGQDEEYVLGQVEPFLPELFDASDALCEERALPQCVDDGDCPQGSPTAGCCEVVGLTRCLPDDSCPDIDAPDVELMGCLEPVLSCFGADAVPTECLVDAIDGTTGLSYTRSRSAIFDVDASGALSISTRSGGVSCWTAVATATTGMIDRYVIHDVQGGGDYTVVIQGEASTVTCPDQRMQAIPTEEFTRFLPPLLGEDDPLCEFQCGTDTDCEGERCCLVEEGYRCLNTNFCPGPVNMLEDSCIGATLSCFGESPEQVSCIDYDGLPDLTYVAYRSGAQAAYYNVFDTPHLRARFSPRECFDAVLEGDRYEVQDLETGSSYAIQFAGADAQITCPGVGVETLAAAVVRRYFPARPDPLTCDPPMRDDRCQLDADCTNPLLPVCCDLGTQNRCNSEDGCMDAAPRALCEGLDGCSGEEVCCVKFSPRVCDFSRCGDALCCRPAEARVCDTQDACEAVDRCDPDVAGQCGAGQRCCQGLTSEAYDCRGLVECRDFAPPSCAVDGDCAVVGGGWRCCEDEASALVCTETNGGACPVFGDRCQGDLECGGGGEVCCGPVGARRCVDALLCEDSCSTNAECPGEGNVCCPDTHRCARAIDCNSPGLCGSDADCEAGVCCKAFADPICTNVVDCPAPCASEDDCPVSQICCASQASVYGPHCSAASACSDVQDRMCTRNTDCGGGELCCRTLDVPICLSADQCPVACHDDTDCGLGQECCGADVRTPVCVDAGTCARELGESCADGTPCEDGLSCCSYDQFGMTCVPPEYCGRSIPSGSCEADPGACNAFPLATCCRIGGVATCATIEECDAPPSRLCTDLDSCGPSGLTCCETAVEGRCLLPDEGICGQDGTCNSNADCGQPLLCCQDSQGVPRCLPNTSCGSAEIPTLCSGPADCPGRTCCVAGPVLVCDPARCGGERCCSLNDPICADPADCL